MFFEDKEAKKQKELQKLFILLRADIWTIIGQLLQPAPPRLLPNGAICVMKWLRACVGHM